MPRHKLNLLRAQNNAFPWDQYDRPKTRGDCLPGGINGVRPCPFVSCRYHLAVNVNRESGSLSETYPGKSLDEVPATCSLDIADEGGSTLEQVGNVMNVTREAARLVEAKALKKLRDARDPLLLEHVETGPVRRGVCDDADDDNDDDGDGDDVGHDE
jgi:hypothetical protein